MIVTSFLAKKLEKQLTYERHILRNLSYKHVQEAICSFWNGYMCTDETVRMQCIEFAVEAYLLGAQYSRFGLYGEDVSAVKSRCIREERSLVQALYEQLCIPYPSFPNLFYVCGEFISNWWEEGFHDGLRRKRLRLK